MLNTLQQNLYMEIITHDGFITNLVLSPKCVQMLRVGCRAVILNWWVATHFWVADPFSVGRGPLPGQLKKI